MGNQINTGPGSNINDDVLFNGPSYDPPCPPGVFVIDSSSIHFSGSGSTCVPLQAFAILSGRPGNSLQIFTDGLYASGGTGGGTTLSAGIGIEVLGGLINFGIPVSSSGHTFTTSRKIDLNGNTFFINDSNYNTSTGFFAGSLFLEGRGLVTDFTSARVSFKDLTNTTQLYVQFSNSVLQFVPSVGNPIIQLGSTIQYINSVQINTGINALAGTWTFDASGNTTVSKMSGTGTRFATFNAAGVLGFANQFISGATNPLLVTGGNISLKVSTVGGNSLQILSDGIYASGGTGGGNLDATLALGGNFTADRSSNMTSAFKWSIDNAQFVFTNVYSQTAPKPLFTISPKSTISGYEILRAFTNSTNNLVPYQFQISETPNGPPDDNVFIQGWNADQTFSSDPSQTTRMEYKYLGGLFEYHYQWQELSSSRAYRLFSSTFQNVGTAATDLNLWYFQGHQFEIRPLGGSSAYLISQSNSVNWSLFAGDAGGNSGFLFSGSASSGSTGVNISPQGTAAQNLLFATAWNSIAFSGVGGGLTFTSSTPNRLNNLISITNAGIFQTVSSGGAADIYLTAAGTTSVLRNDTYNQAYFGANSAGGGHFFYTGNGTNVADFQVNANGYSHIWNNTRITNVAGIATDVLVQPSADIYNVSLRLMLPTSGKGLQFYTLNSGFVASGIQIPRCGLIYADDPAGLGISAGDASGTIRFAAGGLAECARFEATGKFNIAAATAAKGQINFAVGVNPTSPVTGDLWSIATKLLYRDSSVTYNILRNGIIPKNASYTLSATDTTVLVDATVSGNTQTLPDPTTVKGVFYDIKKIDASANSVTLSTPSGTIDGAPTAVILVQYASITVKSDGTNYYII